MAVKHVQEYFNQICSDYSEMLQTLKDFEEEASRGLISPDRLDQFKASIEPIKTNYLRWSYMMYLLNMPVRKNKKAGYDRRSNKILQATTTAQSDLEENRETLENLKSQVNR